MARFAVPLGAAGAPEPPPVVGPLVETAAIDGDEGTSIARPEPVARHRIIPARVRSEPRGVRGHEPGDKTQVAQGGRAPRGDVATAMAKASAASPESTIAKG